MEFEAETAFEPVLAVKSGGFGVDGVHKEGTATNDLRACICASQCVFQESRAKTLTLLSAVHCKARQQHDRNRFWCCFASAYRGFLSGDAARSERVIADYPEISMYDVSSRVSAGLVHACEPLQPLSKGDVLAAVELSNVVVRGQQFDS